MKNYLLLIDTILIVITSIIIVATIICFNKKYKIDEISINIKIIEAKIKKFYKQKSNLKKEISILISQVKNINNNIEELKFLYNFENIKQENISNLLNEHDNLGKIS